MHTENQNKESPEFELNLNVNNEIVVILNKI